MKKRINTHIGLPLACMLGVGGMVSLAAFTHNPGDADAAFAGGAVTYISRSWDSQTKTVVDTENSSTSCSVVTAETTEWEDGGWYVVSTDVTIADRITASGNVSLILSDGATLTAEKGITVMAEDSLTIYGQSSDTGAIVVNAEAWYAAIGSYGARADSGTITIHGGSITANGGFLAAAIGGGGDGGGKGGDGGNTTIFGGTVIATGGYRATAIGGGIRSSGGTISIYGGDVTAIGGEEAAAIGGAAEALGGTITIAGGQVTAYGGEYGAGIGCGGAEFADEGDLYGAGTINITGGKVTATGGAHGGAGIGGGLDADGGTITISGGEILASGAQGASGIGKGHMGPSEGTLTITDESLVVLGNNQNVPSYPDDVIENYATKRYRYMAVKTFHTHDWSYTASGGVITATCGTESCPITSGLTLELEAPANLTYDGSAKTATIKTGYNAEVFPNPEIKYYQGTNEVTSCVNVGTYQAKVTFGDATAVAEFSITKATPTPAEVTDRNATYGQTLSEIALPEGWAWNAPTDKVGNAGTRQHKATFTPVDTANYSTIEQNVKVIVAKATPTVNAPTGLTSLANKTLSTIALPAGWAWDDPNQSVGSEAGEKTFKATFTPEDVENYNLLEHVDVTVSVYVHEHAWTYTANGASITASCGTAECPISSSLTLTLKAPAGDLHYDGNAKVATIQAGYSEEAFPNPVIQYFQGSSEVASCVNVGKYTAKVAFGNATASVDFEILGKVLNDDTSKVSVEIDDAVVPEGVELRVEVRSDVKEKQTPEEYAKIGELLKANERIVKVFDVKLVQTIGGVEKQIQPSDLKPGLTIRVRMTVPSDVGREDLRILHIHNSTDMEFVEKYNTEGDDFIFEVSKLSQFAFINTFAPAANGGIIALIVILSVLAAFGICFLLLFFVFAKFIIVKDKEGNEKIAKAIKLGKEKKEDKELVRLFTFLCKKELRAEEEVFAKKEDAEAFLKNRKGE